MSNELVNADFSRRVVIATDELPWIPSPQAGIERRIGRVEFRAGNALRNRQVTYRKG